MPMLIESHDSTRRLGSADGNNLVTSFTEHKRTVSFSAFALGSSGEVLPDASAQLVHVETATFRANVCRSMLSVDADELYFDECLPGNTYIKDFTVWNRSEIPLWFRVQSSAPNFSVIDCTLFDTNERISADGCRVANYGHCHIRVTFKAQDVGEHEYPPMWPGPYLARPIWSGPSGPACLALADLACRLIGPRMASNGALTWSLCRDFQEMPHMDLTGPHGKSKNMFSLALSWT